MHNKIIKADDVPITWKDNQIKSNNNKMHFVLINYEMRVYGIGTEIQDIIIHHF